MYLLAISSAHQHTSQSSMYEYHYFSCFMKENFETSFFNLSITFDMTLTSGLFLVSREWKCHFSPGPKKWSRDSARNASASCCRGAFHTSLTSIAYLPIDKPRVESACLPMTLHIPSTIASFLVMSKQWV